MRVSCSSLFLWEFEIEDIVEVLCKSGINSIEFWAETPSFWLKRDDPLTREKLVQAVSRLKYSTVHVPILDLNPSSYNDGVSDVTLNETLWSIQLAKDIGADLVTLHPGSRTVRREPTPYDWKKFKNYLTESCELASQLNITLALENTTPRIQNMCTGVDEMQRVLDEFPGLMFTFDIMHALSHSFDFALSFLELSEQMVNIHVGNVKDSVHHLPLHTSADSDAEKILYALNEKNHDSILTIEINDLVYTQELTLEDKISELILERKYLENIFNPKTDNSGLRSHTHTPGR